MTGESREQPDDIHTWFGLTYSNYLVLPRTLLQSMPEPWQHQFTAMLGQLSSAFSHVPQPEAYKVAAAEEHIVREMTPEQLARAGITTEDGPCREDHDHGASEGADCWPEVTYTDEAAGREMDPHERVLIPVQDPVPHYNRGRAYIEPQLPAAGGPGDQVPAGT